jgi:hypothetical protein
LLICNVSPVNRRRKDPSRASADFEAVTSLRELPTGLLPRQFAGRQAMAETTVKAPSFSG